MFQFWITLQLLPCLPVVIWYVVKFSVGVVCCQLMVVVFMFFRVLIRILQRWIQILWILIHLFVLECYGLGFFLIFVPTPTLEEEGGTIHSNGFLFRQFWPIDIHRWELWVLSLKVMCILEYGIRKIFLNFVFHRESWTFKFLWIFDSFYAHVQ